jgi:Ankyrin repeats (3 copies)
MMVASMNPSRSKVCSQLPPTWEYWIEALDALVNHDASVHETVNDRPLSTFNIVRKAHPNRALAFFRLLIKQSYVEFDVINGIQCWSAALTALKAGADAVDALRLLKTAGVDLTVVMKDGRNLLHMAAEFSTHETVLEYLCKEVCQQHINQQDIWGWTPLHHCILSEYSGQCRSPMEKVAVLLKYGAETSIKGGSTPVWRVKTIPENGITPYELCERLSSSLAYDFVQVMKRMGMQVDPDMDEEVFQDAVEF